MQAGTAYSTKRRIYKKGMIKSSAIQCDSGIKNVGQKTSVMSLCAYITKDTFQKLASKHILTFFRVVRMPVKKLSVSSYL